MSNRTKIGHRFQNTKSGGLANLVGQDMNRVFDAVESLSGLRGIGIKVNGSNYATFAENDKHLWVKITAATSIEGVWTYSWIGTHTLADGTVEVIEGSPIGSQNYTPAYEVNNAKVSVGTIVLAWWTEDNFLEFFAGTGDGGDGTDRGDCGPGCGWVAGLRSTDCLRITFLSSFGSCTDDVPDLDENLSFDTDAWVSEDTVEFAEDEYLLKFDRDPENGSPRLYVTESSGSAPETYYATLDCCGEDYAIFAFGGEILCPGDEECPPTPPSQNIVRYKVQWQCCPNPDWDGPGWYCTEDDCCVYYDEDPCDCVEILSGPYETEEDCDVVCVCDGCAYAPAAFSVVGAEFAGDWSDYNGSWDVLYTGSVWTVTVGGITVTVSIAGETLTVTFSGAPGGDAVYEAVILYRNCCEIFTPDLVTTPPEGSSGPDEVAVSADCDDIELGCGDTTYQIPPVLYGTLLSGNPSQCQDWSTEATSVFIYDASSGWWQTPPIEKTTFTYIYKFRFFCTGPPDYDLVCRCFYTYTDGLTVYNSINGDHIVTDEPFSPVFIEDVGTTDPDYDIFQFNCSSLLVTISESPP